jgi:hypothetical protein
VNPKTLYYPGIIKSGETGEVVKINTNFAGSGNNRHIFQEQKFQEAVLTAGPRKVNIKHIYI